MNKKDLRKKLYVSSLIQGRIIGRLALYWALYHAVLWNVMFVYRYLQYRGELLAGAPPQSFGELYQTFTLQHYSMLVCAIAIGPIVLWDALRVTHRIAGPLVRFQNSLKELAAGNAVEPIRLRDGDLLQDFQDVFNEFLASSANPANRDAAAPDHTIEPVELATVEVRASEASSGKLADSLAEAEILVEVEEIRESLAQERQSPESSPQPLS